MHVLNGLVLVQPRDVYKVGSVSVDERREGESVRPAGGEVVNADVIVALCRILSPLYDRLLGVLVRLCDYHRDLWSAVTG